MTGSYRPYGTIGKATAAIARQRRTNPPRPEPRTDYADAAVELLERTPCPGRPLHLIPKTATVCLYCATDALDLVKEATK